MSIYAHRDHIKQLIADKEQQLAELATTGVGEYHTLVLYSMKHMLNIHIQELNRLLITAEQACKQTSDDSWITNPDRMGGCYTEDELRNEGWK